MAALPASGTAWNNLLSKANQSCGTPDLENQDDATNGCILAKALVFARTRQTTYRGDVMNAIWAIVNSGAYNGRALSLGRELGAYVIAADLIDLKSYDTALDALFRSKIKALLITPTTGASSSLVHCHEDRPNNWGTHCGASRAAVAVYLGDTVQLARIAQVFKGYLGSRSSYAGFSYGSDLTWQFSAAAPVGINPAGATKQGHSIDGVLPDDQRRGGGFIWPPPKENYVWEALQGAVMQAVILKRAGYDVFNWENQALLRAVAWLHTQANYPAEGDDRWIPHVINHYYGTKYPAPSPTTPGKNMGWTDWTHQGAAPAAPALSVSVTALSFSATQGGANPSAKSIQISNTGGGSLNWSASATKSWLTLTPSSGSTAATISVSLNSSGLLAGAYSDTITISASGAQGSPKSVSVALTISPPPQSVMALSVAPNPVTGGATSTGTVTISSPAPSGGKLVTLTDNSSMVSVPSSVTVAAGGTKATFSAATLAVSSRQQASITASLNGSIQAVLIIDPPADTTAPVISSVAASSLTASSATITWTTNEPADTQIEYGTSTAYGSISSLNTATVTSHGATLSGLLAGATYNYRVKSRDAAGNLAVSANFTFQTATASIGTACKTVSSAWQNAAFATQTGTFTARFDATPNAANMDGVIGLSAGPASNYRNLAAIVRFYTNGRIDARNGGAYQASTAISYTPGARYHFRLVVRVASRRYDIYVTPPGSSEKVLGLNYAFRTEQATVTSLGNYGMFAGSGADTICNFKIN